MLQHAERPARKTARMDQAIFVDTLLVIGALSALGYWVFLAPARRRRRQAPLGVPSARVAAWDPELYEGRRNR